ncbi:tumor necrosis factor receptor superfamily member 1A isoform X2 [Emydura macquarii macquarii]|uniref:tumor necrosis factor receptor superfamily member 1A isoform X2 n=1 Tax=Emydura macquarii macquarii TaxID=1129001 RepID=UPI00352B6A2F
MLILTLTWVWTEECLGVAPNPDTLRIHGTALGRKRREPKCQIGEYLHPNGTHCCMRCHPGTYLAEHCLPGTLAPRCLQCPEGTFTAKDNAVRKCYSCQRCRSEFHQITLSECTEKEDTVCGCLPNQYRNNPGNLFQCKNCSSCHNGTIWQKCTTTSDTICVCAYGFFLQDYKCNPCSSCSKEECKKTCDSMQRIPTSPSVQKEYWGTWGQTLVLIGVVVVLAAVLGLFVAVKLIKQYRKRGSIPIFYSCVSTQQPKREPVSEVSKVMMNETKASTLALESPPTEATWTVSVVPRAMVAVELPDCVRPAGKTQLPDNPAVLYTVVEHVLPSRWKEFVRRLGLSDYEIERIEMEQRRLRDAQYEMLRQWRLQMAQGATVERISSVLNQMELSGCSEAIQEALSRQP